MGFKDSDFYFRVSQGKVPKHSAVLIGGYNPNLSNGVEEDIWFGGSTLVPLTTARQISFVSDNVLDNGVTPNTGLRTFFLSGLDSSGNSQIEFITLNGTTPVLSVNTYLWVQSLIALTAGVTKTNQGNITGTAQVDLTLQISMPPLTGLTQKSQYKVPTGKTLFVLDIELAAAKTSGGGTAVIQYRGLVDPFTADSAEIQVFSRKLDTSLDDQLVINQRVTSPITEGAIFRVTGLSDTNNIEARLRVTGILVED